MNLTDFYDEIEPHLDLKGIDVIEDKDDPPNTCFILHNRHTSYSYTIDLAFVDKNSWETIELMLMVRIAEPILHLSRIVGYFSRIENWNKSKLGELADRRKVSHLQFPSKSGSPS